MLKRPIFLAGTVCRTIIASKMLWAAFLCQGINLPTYFVPVAPTTPSESPCREGCRPQPLTLLQHPPSRWSGSSRVVGRGPPEHRDLATQGPDGRSRPTGAVPAGPRCRRVRASTGVRSGWTYFVLSVSLCYYPIGVAEADQHKKEDMENTQLYMIGEMCHEHIHKEWRWTLSKETKKLSS